MKNIRLLCLTFLVVVGISQPCQATPRGKTTLIVMPVRHTVVQFVFDIARIRPVQLLAYDKGVGDEALLLHMWDFTKGDWCPAEIEAYQNGTLFASKLERAFLIGEEADLPAEISDSTGTWCKDVTRIPSLKVVDMANAMDRKLKFSEHEWRTLAKRHSLKLTDDHAERRRYGRYGKPGTQPVRPHKVNPLIARFQRSKQSPVSEAPAIFEEEIDREPVEANKEVHEPAWSKPVDETPAAVQPEVVEKAAEDPAEETSAEPLPAMEAPEEAETAAEFK